MWIGLPCALATVAGAATVSLNGSAAAYVAEGEQQNRLRVLNSGTQLRFTDARAKLNAGRGCVAADDRTVDCPLERARAIQVDLGAGDDAAIVTSDRQASLVGAGGADVLGGGKGADTISGGLGADLIGGGAGDDSLRGGPGGDLLRGGGGRDRLLAGSGNDVLQSGEGQDFLGGGGGRDQLFPGGDRAPDLVSCGGALDFALVFRTDRVRGCEFVRRR
jgi:Ca2+-binding RTX toxin-like protein